MLPGDHDALDEEAEDRLLGVEVGVEEHGFERLDDLLGSGCAVA